MLHVGRVERLEHVAAHVFSTCLGVQRNIREQYRTFLGRASILTEYLRNVGDTTLKTSLAVPTQSTPWSSPLCVSQRTETNRPGSPRTWRARRASRARSASCALGTPDSSYFPFDRIDPPHLTENLRNGGATALISSQMVPTQSTSWSCVRLSPGTKELL